MSLQHYDYHRKITAKTYIVQVERPEDVPTPEAVDDLEQRLLAVAFYEAERHARLVKVLDLPLDGVELAGLVTRRRDEARLLPPHRVLQLLHNAPPGLAGRDRIGRQPAAAR